MVYAKLLLERTAAEAAIFSFTSVTNRAPRVRASEANLEILASVVFLALKNESFFLTG